MQGRNPLISERRTVLNSRLALWRVRHVQVLRWNSDWALSQAKNNKRKKKKSVILQSADIRIRLLGQLLGLCPYCMYIRPRMLDHET